MSWLAEGIVAPLPATDAGPVVAIGVGWLVVLICAAFCLVVVLLRRRAPVRPRRIGRMPAPAASSGTGLPVGISLSRPSMR
jgi:hypothetical protein